MGRGICGPGRRAAARAAASCSGAELGKVRQEVANYREFLAVSEQIVEVSEAICEARPVAAGQRRSPRPGRPGKGGAPGGVRGGGRRGDRAPGQRGGAVAGRRRGGPGGGRAGHPHRDGQARRQRAGAAAGRRPRPPRPAGRVRGWPPGGVRLLPGQDHRHRAGAGHPAPGLVSLRRSAGTGSRPGTLNSASAQASMSPGLRAMTARAAAAVPFAKAGGLLAELAGIA